VVVPFSGADASQVYTQGNPYSLDQDLVYSIPEIKGGLPDIDSRTAATVLLLYCSNTVQCGAFLDQGVVWPVQPSVPSTGALLGRCVRCPLGPHSL